MAANAHDAGRVGQLMLMMLAETGPWGKQGAADAHDAGRALPCAGDQRQLMLMPVGFGRVGRTRAS